MREQRTVMTQFDSNLQSLGIDDQDVVTDNRSDAVNIVRLDAFLKFLERKTWNNLGFAAEPDRAEERS